MLLPYQKFKLALIKAIQYKQCSVNLKCVLVLLFITLVLLFGVLHFLDNFTEQPCKGLLSNGTSKGGQLDSWHTDGCNIHKYTEE